MNGKLVASLIGVSVVAIYGTIFYEWSSAVKVRSTQQTTKEETAVWLDEVKAKYPMTDNEKAERDRLLVDNLNGKNAFVAPPISAWSTSDYKDAMSSKTVYQVNTYSTNTLNFKFPYHGEQNARLSVRKHPRWGTDVSVNIRKGQLLCGYPTCSVKVRFDEGPAQTFSAIGPDDNSSEHLFIQGTDRFISQLKKSKVVQIEMTVYQEGAPVVKFDTQNFPAAHFTAPTKVSKK